VFGNISKIKGNTVEFEGGKENAFDAIVFATGYKSTAYTWLKVHSNINFWPTMQQI
jgi:indole-3-pyruvate monooxygenase